MEFRHKPVLFDECMDNLDIKLEGTYIDGTLGGAGHSSGIIQRLDTKGTLIGIDQDSYALKASEARLKELGGKARLIIEKGNFRSMADICDKHGIDEVDGILLDIGVSSHQLDEAERGFSYQHDAPLDMRMDCQARIDAAYIVNNSSEVEIRRIISEYGEENWASRIAAFIIKARHEKRIETTGELVEIIKAAIPAKARREGPHPAKRTFQALRIAVNDELGALEEAIGHSVKLLKSGGRLCIITFHSLEDRIVKNEFQIREKPCRCPKEFPVCVCGRKPELKVISRKPIVVTESELQENPRARSAKLRVAEKV